MFCYKILFQERGVGKWRKRRGPWDTLTFSKTKMNCVNHLVSYLVSYANPSVFSFFKITLIISLAIAAFLKAKLLI